MKLRFLSFLKRHKSIIFLIGILFLITAGGFTGLMAQDKGSRIPIPNLSFNVNEARGPKETSLSLMILFLVTILSLAPAIVMSVTSFTKVVIVFDFVRRALSLQNLPPNQVMMGLALFVTFLLWHLLLVR